MLPKKNARVVTDRSKAAAEEPELPPTAQKLYDLGPDEKEASLSVETQHLDEKSIEAAPPPRSDADFAAAATNPNQQLALLEVTSEPQSSRAHRCPRQFIKTCCPLFLNAQIESNSPTSTPPATPPPLEPDAPRAAGWGWFSSFEGGCVPCFEGSPYGARGLL